LTLKLLAARQQQQGRQRRRRTFVGARQRNGKEMEMAIIAERIRYKWKRGYAVRAISRRFRRAPGLCFFYKVSSSPHSVGW
jgi:hypothetical protein